jgi:uncharacterized protein (TIGR02757 family)
VNPERYKVPPFVNRCSEAARHTIEAVYEKFHRPEFIDPDPLAVVRRYTDPADREIAGLVCSSLALGRVTGIIRACGRVLSIFDRPRSDLLRVSVAELSDALDGFVYRFFGRTEIVSLLLGIKRTIEEYGSLEACFLEGYRPHDDTTLPALSEFIRELSRRAEGRYGMLLSDPAKGGAAKRLHLFLRWTVRCDTIDPGGWNGISPAHLIYPMDTHMLRVARLFGFTRKTTADLSAALEVTAAFRSIRPEDPVRYDFSLTRPGIHPALSPSNEFRLPSDSA